MSSYRKYMDFPIHFPQYGKMQQNPWYGESLGNWYPLFPRSMGAHSHPMVYFIIWEIHWFLHQFSKLRKNATKATVWGEPGKLIVILFPQYEWFFPIRFPLYGILHHMGNAFVSPPIFHRTGKWNKTHRMGWTWENGTHTFPMTWVLFCH